MRKQAYPPQFLKLLRGVKAKRPKTVIQHILEHGQITTEELKDIYGYNHPPRAIRDVREQGIPIITFRVTGTDGRKIAAYKFGDPSEVRAAKLSGQTAFSSDLKSALMEKYGPRCNIYLSSFPVSELQIDHRVPFEIIEDHDELSDDIDEYMLLCASANRTKSWNCERCANWQQKSISTCRSCYWAYPESYTHIAMRNVRRLDLLWADEEVSEYERLVKKAKKVREPLPEYAKNVFRRHLRDESN